MERISPTAYGGNRGKDIRTLGRPRPQPRSSHADARAVYSAPVNAERRKTMPKERLQLPGNPPFTRDALGDNHDEGHLSHCAVCKGSMLPKERFVVGAFACSVEVDERGPCVVLSIGFGKLDKASAFDRNRSMYLKSLNTRSMCHRSAGPYASNSLE